MYVVEQMLMLIILKRQVKRDINEALPGRHGPKSSDSAQMK